MNSEPSRLNSRINSRINTRVLRNALAAAIFTALAAQAAAQQDVLLYKRGEVPDPNAIARILGGKTAPAQAPSRTDSLDPGAAQFNDDDGPVRTRGIRLLPPDSAGEARQQAPAERALNQLGARPVMQAANQLALQQAAPAPASAFALQVQFPFNSAELQPEMFAQLDAVAEGIRRAMPAGRIVLEGHTDAAGTAEYNQFLSRRRAEAVRNYLVFRHGLPPQLFMAVGRGKLAPLIPDNPFAAENRRVEFRLADS